MKIVFNLKYFSSVVISDIQKKLFLWKRNLEILIPHLRIEKDVRYWACIRIIVSKEVDQKEFRIFSCSLLQQHFKDSYELHGVTADGAALADNFYSRIISLFYTKLILMHLSLNKCLHRKIEFKFKISCLHCKSYTF